MKRNLSKKLTAFVLSAAMLLPLLGYIKNVSAATDKGSVIWLKKQYTLNGTGQCFTGGLAQVEYKGKYGLIDKTGKEVVPTKYDLIGEFSEGLANVVLYGKNDLAKNGFIDKTGKIVIPIKYDCESPVLPLAFSEGLCPVGKAVKNASSIQYGYIDKTGKIVIPIKYQDVREFVDGIAPVELNNKWGVIDKKGKVIIPLQYDDIDTSYSGGLILVFKVKSKSSREKCGLIDKKGSVVIPIKYDYICDFSEGLAQVWLNDKCGFIDQKGKIVIPIKYDGAAKFSEGLAGVCMKGKCGFIDKKGKLVIPYKYAVGDDWDEFTYFYKGIAEVSLPEYNFFCIDKKGKKVQLKPDGYLSGMSKYIDGLAAAWNSKERYGFIDESYNVVIPFEYKYAGDFSEELALVCNEKGLYGYIDESGNEIIPFEYKDACDFYEGVAFVERGGRLGIIKNPLLSK